MINVVGPQCGLGNQLFIYACYLRLKKEKGNVFIRNIQRKRHERYGCELDRAFGLKITNIPSFIDRLLFNKYMLKYVYSFISESFDPPSFVSSKHKSLISYYYGFYHSTDFFKGVENEVKKAFVFSEKFMNRYTIAMEREIVKLPNTVSIHIRRGDYTNDPDKFGNICTESYYREAILYIQNEIGRDISYYVFSDDLDYARRLFQGLNAVFVDGNRNEDSFLNLYLMSKCQHNIIANSTFSWWGLG